jgi:hypothetical protein
MEKHTNIPLQTPDIQTLAGMEQRMLAGMREMLHDPALLNHLAEEIADRLDGFDDKTMGHLIDEAARTSPVVSEEEVLKALKT